jgi:uracil-DNA glycosylase
MTTLLEWCDHVYLQAGVKFHANVSNIKTPGNRPLNRQEIDAGMDQLIARINAGQYTHIVALGKVATKALQERKVSFLSMPHPSGLNRKLNDSKYVERCLDRLRSYVDGPGLNEVTLERPR